VGGFSIKISFAHHISISYGGGGEKWVINTAKALQERGHEVTVNALPFLLDGKPKINPKEHLDGIPYKESYFHHIKADVCYLTYHPLSALSFRVDCPKIAGFHSDAYWQKPNLHYGTYPLAASIVNRFVSYAELKTFAAVHRLNSLYHIKHPHVYTIPNYVDSTIYKPIKKANEFTVAYASRQVWQKGFDIFKRIEKHLNCRVNISGGIAEADMPAFLSDAHVVVAPSRVDTFGLALCEASLCGTPVVTSPLPSHVTLGLPFKYAVTPQDYLDQVNRLQKETSYPLLSDVCRFSAMRYDSSYIMDKLENMLTEVAYCANN
jgi:glycosyltransferase involved in cell wall biosynthesis